MVGLLRKLGAYQWAKTNGTKQPYYFRLKDDSPFAFGGLWGRWEKGDGPVETCALLTTEPNALARRVHDRMPVLLHLMTTPPGWTPKLQDPEALRELLRPYPAARMAAENRAGSASPFQSCSTRRGAGGQLSQRAGGSQVGASLRCRFR